MLKIREEDAVQIIEFNHGKANALDLEFCNELIRTFKELSKKPRTAIVLAGNGRIFSAGVDLFQLEQNGRPYVERFLPKMSELFQTVFESPVPVVSALNGSAIAGGCVIAAASDWRVMTDGPFHIGVSGMKVGLPFPVVPTEILRHAYPHRLEEMILHSRLFNPEEALSFGLVNEVTPAGREVNAAVRKATALLKIPRKVFQVSKNRLRGPAVARYRELQPRTDPEVEALWADPEVLKSVKSYLEKLRFKE